MFPQKFLKRMAQIHQLSADQESVFLLRFGEDREDREVTSFSGISEEAYRKRMGEIYRKFDISGKGPGKNNRLLHILQNYLEFQKIKLFGGQIILQNICQAQWGGYFGTKDKGFVIAMENWHLALLRRRYEL